MALLRRCSTPALVLVLLFASLHGGRFALAGEDYLQNWIKVKELYVDMADNAQKEGESCDWGTDSSARNSMMKITGKEPAEAVKEGSGKFQMDKLASDKKGKVCSTGMNLFCDLSSVCKTCDGRADLDFCITSVFKIRQNLREDRKSVGSGGGTKETGDGKDNKKEKEGDEAGGDDEVADKSGVVATACGSSCRILIIILGGSSGHF